MKPQLRIKSTVDCYANLTPFEREQKFYQERRNIKMGKTNIFADYEKSFKPDLTITNK